MLHTTAAQPASVPLQAAGRWLRGAWRHFLQSEEEVAFPAGGSPSLTALRLGESQGGRKWDLIASRDTEEGNVWDCLRGAAGGPRLLSPFSPQDHPRRPGGSAARRRHNSIPEAKAPEREHDPLWATHQVEGSFHYFHRPRGKRRPEEGERRRRGTWRERVVEGATQRWRQLPLSAPRETALGAEGATTAPLPPPVARRGPAPCAAATHASWRHTWLVQGGSGEREEWVGFRGGGAWAVFPLARGVSLAS